MKILFSNQTHSAHNILAQALIVLLAMCLLNNAYAQTNIDTSSTKESNTSLSQAEVAQILAPIALYPDTLLTHILIASTYPLEVIEAERWLSKNDPEDNNFSNDEIFSRTEEFDWDPSVKALLPFGEVLKKMSEDLTWTRKLGDAFLENEDQVLNSIQTLRKQAEKAGSLEKMDNLAISKEDENIIIQPVQREIVYVPYYDTRIVYGTWYWSNYPPIYWHYPHYYTSIQYPFYWRPSIHIGINFFFSGFHWSNHHVVRISHHSNRYRPTYRVSTSNGAKRWQHNPTHRRGVAYRNIRTQQKYHSNRTSVAQVNSQRHATNKVINEKLFKNNSHQKTMNATNNRQNSKYQSLNKKIKYTSKNKYTKNRRTANEPARQKATVSNKAYKNEVNNKSRNYTPSPSKGGLPSTVQKKYSTEKQTQKNYSPKTQNTQKNMQKKYSSTNSSHKNNSKRSNSGRQKSKENR